MKRWLLGLSICALAGTIGCGGQSAATTEGGAANEAAATGNGADAPVGTVGANAEKATKVVERFLTALQSGDSAVAEGLLTDKARKETAAHDWKVQPPGSPDAKFLIVESALKEGITYVSSDWTEAVSESEAATYNIIWMLKPDKGEWRISGMITEFGADSDLMLSFEDIEGMIKTIQEAEASLALAAAEAQKAAMAAQQAALSGPSASTAQAAPGATLPPATAPTNAAGPVSSGLNGSSLEFDAPAAGGSLR